MEKKLQPLKNKLLLFFFLLCVLPNLYSQTVAGDYTFSYNTGTYSEIGGNNILGISNDWDNFNPQSVNLGFSFYFNGNSYTSCFVNPNGYITFGTPTSTGSISNPISSDEGFSGAISGFGRDLRYGANNNASRIRYLTSGIEHERVFTVQWKNARRVGENSGTVNFQIRLYEGSNKIEVAYGDSNIGSTTNYPVQVGLRGASNADFNNRTTTKNWSSSTPGTANNSTNAVTSSVKPVQNSIYTWTLTTISGNIPLTVNGTYTVPCGVTSLKVETWGGGGGGAAGSSKATGGGGGGAYAKKTFAVSAGDSFNYQVGAGGSGGSSNKNGGDTWFKDATTLLAKGGKGGVNNDNKSVMGGLASESIGDMKWSGGTSGTAVEKSWLNWYSGGGGGAATTTGNGGDASYEVGGSSATPGGNGGNGDNSLGAGGAGANYGGGGAGVKAIGNQNGANGAQGYIRLSYSYPNPGTPPPISAISDISSDPTTDIGCESNEVTLQANGGNTGAGVSTLWYTGSTCPSIAYAQEFMGNVYTVSNTTVGTVTGGNRRFTSTTNDPIIYMENVLLSAIDPAVHRYMIIRYRVVSGTGGDVEIYFKKSDQSFAEDKVVRVPINNDNNWHIMTIDMGTNANWNNEGGNITGWRFDYASLPDVVMDIDYLALSSLPILENINEDDYIFTLQATAADTTIGALRIADQAAVCNGSVPVTTCTQNVIHRSDKTFTGTSDSWNTAANWSFAGIPDNSNCVKIPAGKTVKIDIPNAAAKSITVANGGAVEITSGNALTVTNAIINQGNGDNFVVESDANLIQINDAAVNTGNITLKRDSKMKRLDYIYWGTPVEGQTLKTFSPNTVANRFYSYKEIDDTFSVITPLTNPMVKGQGYVIRAPNNFTTALQTWPATFTGKPHNGIVDVAVTQFGAGKNLVGNPYPSNINLDQLTLDNPATANGVYYFWTNINDWVNNNTSTPNGESGNYEDNNYALYNSTGGVPSAGNTQKPSGIVKPGQGFLYEARAAGNLRFKNNVRTNEVTDRWGTASVFISNKTAGAKTAPSAERYWLKLTNPAGQFNTLLLAYIEGATNSFEPRFDAKFPVESSDQFYSLSDGANLIIQGRGYPFKSDDVVPLGMKGFETGTYTMSLQEKEGIFANGQQIYLKDKQTGIITNLSEGSYAFEATAGVSSGRFEIIYEPQTVLAADGTLKENIQVYRDGSDFVIKSPGKKITTIEVYDTSGKLTAKSGANQTEVRMDGTNWVNGVYVLKINRNGELITRKIVR